MSTRRTRSSGEQSSKRSASSARTANSSAKGGSPAKGQTGGRGRQRAERARADAAAGVVATEGARASAGSEMTSDSGPRWLGIGAQRSGTTWFTQLLLQHPQVSLSERDKKELHYFDPFLTRPFTDRHARDYRALFQGEYSGEFTPGYLRWPWVPDLVRRTCGEDVVLIVLLRDPIERFASLLRYAAYRRFRASGRRRPPRGREAANLGTAGAWGGMYAAHLRTWSAHFARDRFIVDQYERIQLDPQTAVERVWSRIGLADKFSLSDVDQRRAASVRAGTDLPEIRLSDELVATLRSAYEADVRELVSEWQIDVGLWPNFAHLDSSAMVRGE